MKKILVIAILLISGFVYSFPITNAAIDTTANKGNLDTTANKTPVVVKLDNPIKVNSISDLLLTLVDLAIYLGSIVAVLMFIYIGFKFVMAQGNDSAISEAKEWFMYAVIGTALLISSKVVVEVVKTTLISAGLVSEQQFKK
jgi:hypothetical protein